MLGDSFSVMAMRKTGVPGAEFEFGARAFGQHPAGAAEALIAQITAWDARGRAIPVSVSTAAVPGEPAHSAGSVGSRPSADCREDHGRRTSPVVCQAGPNNVS